MVICLVFASFVLRFVIFVINPSRNLRIECYSIYYSLTRKSVRKILMLFTLLTIFTAHLEIVILIFAFVQYLYYASVVKHLL